MKNEGTIPASVRYATIPDGAKLLYAEISATAKSGFSVENNKYFAGVLNQDISTISRFLNQLSDIQAIRIEVDRGTRKLILNEVEKIRKPHPEIGGARETLWRESIVFPMAEFRRHFLKEIEARIDIVHYHQVLNRITKENRITLSARGWIKFAKMQIETDQKEGKVRCVN